MKQLQSIKRLLAVGVLLSGSAYMFAQDTPPSQQDPNRPQSGQKEDRDRMAASSTLTGCLNKDASGGYTLTDETTGTKTNVSGSADLEKHSANHRVTLTGSAKSDANGKSMFEVTKLQHMADTCKAPEK
jgi:hypothetical protein